MTVTDVRKSPEELTLTLTCEFDAPVDRVWQLWADPRLLERWWGPPTYPATVVEHELAPGGSVTYYMTGPEGDRHHGWWKVTGVEAPTRLTFDDGFADAEGNPSTDMPVTSAVVTLAAAGDGRTRMVIQSRFPSLESMNRLVEMGMEEGMTLALGQADALLLGV
jgi:uncharacterized protein YndB with AHSA1/START domain